MKTMDNKREFDIEMGFQLGAIGIRSFVDKRYILECRYKPSRGTGLDVLDWDTYGFYLKYKGYRKKKFRECGQYITMERNIPVGTIREVAKLFAKRICDILTKNHLI